ncbi:MAG TPA: 50S ribosomal protein L25/general stress protein Ctc [Gammaproteobacteria bacterium]|nr:50S ribosomal protein L25/general stress protein Ctc [Gammaproteobacteria bacterium]
MKFEINAETRGEKGRAESRKLRRLGRVPAIVYGGGQEPKAITLDRNSLAMQMDLESFYTSILNLQIDKKAQPVVVKEVQRHPARSTVMHLDFQRVVEDEEITLNVPIHFIGEDVAVGARQQGGVIEHIITDVEISCLPAKLPEYLEIDVTALELDEIMHLSDIKYPEGVESTQLAHGHDSPVVAIHPPRREEVEEEAVEAEAAAAPDAAGAEAPEAEAGDEDSDTD